MNIFMSLTVLFLLASCGDTFMEDWSNTVEPKQVDVSYVSCRDSAYSRSYETVGLKVCVTDRWQANYLAHFKDVSRDPVVVGPKSWTSADTLLVPALKNVFLANCKRFTEKPASAILPQENGLFIDWTFLKTRLNFQTRHVWPKADEDTIKISGFPMRKCRFEIDSLIWVSSDTTRVLNPDTLDGKYLVREIVIRGQLRMNGMIGRDDRYGDFKAYVRAVVTKDGSEPVIPNDDELIGLERGDNSEECDHAVTIRNHTVTETTDTIFAIDRYQRPIIHRYSQGNGEGLIWNDTLQAKIVLPHMSRIFMSELVFNKQEEASKAGTVLNGKTYWSKVSDIYFEFPTSFEKSSYTFGGFTLDFNRENEYYYWSAVNYKETTVEFAREIYIDEVKYKLYNAKHLFEALYSDGTKYKFFIPQEVCVKVENGGGTVNPNNPLASLEELKSSSSNQTEFSLENSVITAKNMWKHHINRRYRDGAVRDTVWETTEYAHIYVPRVEKRIVTDLNDFIKNGESWQPGTEHNGKTFWTIVSGTKFIFPTDFEQRVFTYEGMSLKLDCYGFWSGVNYLETSIVNQKDDVSENGATYHVYTASHKFKALYSNGEVYEFVVEQDIWQKVGSQDNELTGLREKSGKSMNFRIDKTAAQIKGLEDYEFVIEKIYKTSVVDTIWHQTTTASIYLPVLPEAIRPSTEIVKNSQTSFAGTNYNGKTFAFVLSGTNVDFETSYETSEFFWKGFGVKMEEYGYWSSIAYLSSVVRNQQADRLVNNVKYNVFDISHKFKAVYSNGQSTEFEIPQIILVKAQEESDDLLDTYVKSRLEWRGSELYSVNEVYEKRRVSGDKLVENKEVNLGWNVSGEALKTVYNNSHAVAYSGQTSTTSTEAVSISGCSGVKTKKVYTHNFGYFASKLENAVVTSLTYTKNGKALQLAAADASLLSAAYVDYSQNSSPTTVNANGNTYNEWPTQIRLNGAYGAQTHQVTNQVNIRCQKTAEATYEGYHVVASQSGMSMVIDADWGIYLSRVVTFVSDSGNDRFSILDVWTSDKNSSKNEHVVNAKKISTPGHSYPCATPQKGASSGSDNVLRAWSLGYLEAVEGSLSDNVVKKWKQIGLVSDAVDELVISQTIATVLGIKTPIVSAGTYNSDTGVYVLDGVSYR